MTIKIKARSLGSRILELGLRWAPKRGHVVLYGFPRTEGNVTALIDQLSQSYKGRIYWLDGELSCAHENGNVKVLRRYSLTGIGKYLTAEVVFFTHGLYGDPRPSQKSTIVNLWHGDGIKIKPLAATGSRSMVPASYVVAGTELLGRRKAHDFRMPESAVLLSGNPRVDLFKDPTKPCGLKRLGLDPQRPFVLWLPTFRSTKAVGATPGWSDTGRSSKSALQGGVAILAKALADAEIQLVVKPHPLDAESREVSGAISITDDSIVGAGTSLYALLASSAGLITDYSSVWTDYLVLDRPIGFLVPDREEYLNGRGVYPADILDALPGPDLTETHGVTEFVGHVLEGGPNGADRREQAVKRLGLIRTDNASLNLLTMLDDRNCFNFSGGLTA